MVFEVFGFVVEKSREMLKKGKGKSNGLFEKGVEGINEKGINRVSSMNGLSL